MSKAVTAIVDVFRYQKLKILLFIGLLIFFILVLFPYDDLGDYVTAQVSEMSKKQVYLQFDGMGFSIFPQPGLKMENVYLESAFAPPIRVKSLAASPSIRGLLTFSPGVSVYAQGLMGGDVSVKTRGGGETAKGGVQQIINLDLEKIDLDTIGEFADLPIRFKGALEGEVAAIVDPAFGDQPDGTFELEIDKFSMPPTTVKTAFGPINLPNLTLAKVKAEGRLKQGELYVDKLTLGNAKDLLSGTAKGKIRIKFVKRGVQIQPNFSNYEMDLDLRVLPDFQKQAPLLYGVLEGFFSKCKKPGIGSTSFPVQLSGTGFYNPPRQKCL